MAENVPVEQGQDHAMYSVILGFVVLAVILGSVLFVFSQREDSDGDENNETPTPTAMTEPTVSPTDVPDGDITDVPTPTITVEPTSEATNEVTFELTGQPYEYSLNEIRVSQGDLVTIEFTSTDGFHDFNIDELGVASDRVNTGNTTTVQFTADQVGTFNFYCSVSNHRAQGMEGVFIVE